MGKNTFQNASTKFLVIIWLLSLIVIFFESIVLKNINGFMLSIYILLVFPTIRRSLKFLCAALAIVTTAIAWKLDCWPLIWHGIEKAVLFAAFFGTLSLLRATADRRREILRSTESVERLGGEERNSGLLIGSFVLGSTLIVGVMAIFAPIVGRKAPLDVRKSAAEASQRGLCLSCLWSPFWVAMAVTSEHLPTVPLWQIMLSGFALSAIGLFTAQVLFTPNVNLRGLIGAILAFKPVFAPVAFAASAVLLLKAATTFTTLECLVLGVPMLCFITLALSGVKNLTSGIIQSGRGLSSISGEIVLLTCSFALGQVLQYYLEFIQIETSILQLSPSPILLIGASVIIMTTCALIGIHQIVTLTLVLVAFNTPSIGLSNLALMQAGLLGWAFASMVGLSAVSVAAASSMFDVPIGRLSYGSNIKFVAIFTIIGITWITFLDHMAN